MKKHEARRAASASFLLAQIGAHAASRFAERLQPLGLSPPHAGILRVLRGSAGLSQQELAVTLKLHPSRLVAIVDELETRGLVSRRENPNDRRTYALFLTETGEATLAEIGRIATEHEEALCASLNKTEREQLAQLLQRIAEEQGLTAGVHPGFSRMGKKSPPAE
ncbi:MarR family winged helix-turn-helix transcriptional regulator [Vitiosangium sp. GDMCC 1.1324]|uniref:MarR family winged helix-turn-helix transcriptional regulator n=1 Tax=Vitiosangium sp. (strain GDMCC 1.1324) TaxID=2138576 RepID=UPI000D356F7E|nr:MarR family transcriptional regulator [Vitiosangium sp. GDMCC 1.1324]PTL85693.1 MarR family transcriptional regulator [Vitiosangium sp. GDMCC 1.1324]